MKIWHEHRWPRAWERRRNSVAGASLRWLDGFRVGQSGPHSRRVSHSPARSESARSAKQSLLTEAGSAAATALPGARLAAWGGRRARHLRVLRRDRRWRGSAADLDDRGRERPQPGVLRGMLT